MDIKLKEMRLIIKKLDESTYTREVYDMSGTLIWSSSKQYYVYEGMIVMDRDRMKELIEQMKNTGKFNIVSIENDFEQ
jgi:hypothetical protein